MASPTGLMCDLLAHPERTVILSEKPRFSWIVPLTLPEDRQTAYQIRVYAEGNAKPIWDSGKVDSDTSVAVSFGGEALPMGKAFSWQVQTWNRQNKRSDWSVKQTFQTATSRDPEPGAETKRHTTSRYPLVQETTHPKKVVPLQSGSVFLDWGQAAFAGLSLTLAGGANGGELVTVHIGEAVDASGQHVNQKPGGSVRYHRAVLTLQPGIHEYIVPLRDADKRRMPSKIGPVMPFRYVEIEGLHAPLIARDARQVAAYYPFDDQAAHFSSSDQTLNEVWDLCKHTIKATTFCGVYVDGDRERLPYEADAYINQLGHYACDREFTLARFTHEFLIQKPTWPTEWFLQSVLLAWHDYLYTGDTTCLAAFYDDLVAKTLLAIARADGLISTTAPLVPEPVHQSVHHSPPTRRIEDIVDWPPAERDGYEMLPINTVVNAFHYAALERMSHIADALGKRTEAGKFADQAAKVKQAINEKLFDAKTGLYIDGEGSTHSSQHANFFPMALGVVPDERRDAVAKFVASKGMACSVYGAQFLLEGLYEAGHADDALALLTAKHDRGWYHMIHGVGSTMALEAWDAKYKPNLDWNHAWGAAPANIIPHYLMGIRPLEPGCRKVRIRPQPGKLQRARLLLPTIRGPIQMEWENRANSVSLKIQLPANLIAEVWLPIAGLGEVVVTRNGKPQQGRRVQDFFIVESVGGGTHQLEGKAE
jgi:alpha-L-rhamnosidase